MDLNAGVGFKHIKIDQVDSIQKYLVAEALSNANCYSPYGWGYNRPLLLHSTRGYVHHHKKLY